MIHRLLACVRPEASPLPDPRREFPCAAGLIDLDANLPLHVTLALAVASYSAPGSAACTMCEANWKDDDLTRRHLACRAVRVLSLELFYRVQLDRRMPCGAVPERWRVLRRRRYVLLCLPGYEGTHLCC